MRVRKRKGERRRRPSREAGESEPGALSELAGAFRSGGREARGRLAGARPGLAAAVLGALATFYAILFELLGGLVRLLYVGATALAGPLGKAGRATDRAARSASVLLTPTRALLGVAIGCAALLAAAQFADYRGVAVGTLDYAGVESVAPAPEVAREETGSAHSYLLAPAAALAALILVFAAASRRWQLCRLAALVGVAAIAVAIFVDRPAGLDEGPVAQQFAGAEAKLLGGFYMQLFAGLGLAVTSLLLGGELRRAGARAAARIPLSPRRRRDSRRPLTAKRAGT